MIKGALFDIDDTLYSHKEKRFPEKTMRLLKALKKQGIKTGVCTSRLTVEMGLFSKEFLDLIDLKIMGTGSTAMIDGQYYKTYSFDPKIAKQYIDYFHKNNISYSYTDINSDIYYYGDEELIEKGHILSWAQREIKIKKYEDEEISNIFYYRVTPIQEEYILSVNKDAYISRWGNSGNICASYVDKSFGVLKFCQVFGLTTDEVVACGDGGNDGEMLQMAGIGIAVYNAKEKTKQMADYVCTTPIEEGGLYDAFVDLKIIGDGDVR